VYKNCYLDIGEVFPMISRDGQERVLQQALELTPWSKLLWSTDGHYYPETFWLANVQGREAMEKVLCNYVESGDLNIDDAVRTARDIFFENSNRLYSLKLQFDARNLPDRSKNAKPTVEEVSRIFNFCQNHIS
jgi:predicted TIM-barrel fold metal-dependent hydrolase